MGTTFIWQTGDMTKVEFLKYILQDFSCKLIDYSIKGNVAYTALETKTGDVFACVFLLYKDGDDRGYKDISEEMGPCEAECPIRILNKLSPTGSEYALEWRKTCRENAMKLKSPKVGQTIKFEKPVKFNDGSECFIFEVTTRESLAGRKIKVYLGNNGRLYRISNIKRMSYIVT